MKKLIKPTIANFFLIVYVSFIFLSCFNESVRNSKDVVRTISNRIKSKDFLIREDLINPFNKQGKEVAIVIDNLSKKYQKNNVFRKKADFFRPNTTIFHRVAIQQQNSEYQTFGIDNHENYELALLELGEYFEGSTLEAASNQMLQTNSILSKYSMNHTGAEQFFTDCENSGKLTPAQSSIIQMELDVLLYATTIQHASDINNMVEYEIINSDMPTAEKNLILKVNAVIKGLLEVESLAADGERQLME